MQRRALVSRQSVRGLDPAASLAALSHSVTQTKQIHPNELKPDQDTGSSLPAGSDSSNQTQSQLKTDQSPAQQLDPTPNTDSGPPPLQQLRSAGPRLTSSVTHQRTSSTGGDSFSSGLVGRVHARDDSTTQFNTHPLRAKRPEPSSPSPLIVDSESTDGDGDDPDEDLDRGISGSPHDAKNPPYRPVLAPSLQQRLPQYSTQGSLTPLTTSNTPMTNDNGLSTPTHDPNGTVRLFPGGSPSPPSPTSSTSSLRQRRLQMMENKNRFRLATPTTGGSNQSNSSCFGPQPSPLPESPDDTGMDLDTRSRGTLLPSGAQSGSLTSRPSSSVNNDPSLSPLPQTTNLDPRTQSLSLSASAAGSDSIGGITAFEMLQKQFEDRHRFLEAPPGSPVSQHNLASTRALSSQDSKLTRHSSLDINIQGPIDDEDDDFEDDHCCFISPRDTPRARSAEDEVDEEEIIAVLKVSDEIPQETWDNTEKNTSEIKIAETIKNISHLKRAYGINKLEVCQCTNPVSTPKSPVEPETPSYQSDDASDRVSITDRLSNTHEITIDVNKSKQYKYLQHQSISDWEWCSTCNRQINPTTRLTTDQLNSHIGEPEEFSHEQTILLESAKAGVPDKSKEDILLRHYSAQTTDFAGTAQDNHPIAQGQSLILNIYPDDGSDLDLPLDESEQELLHKLEEEKNKLVQEISQNEDSFEQDDTMNLTLLSPKSAAKKVEATDTPATALATAPTQQHSTSTPSNPDPTTTTTATTTETTTTTPSSLNGHSPVPTTTQAYQPQVPCKLATQCLDKKPSESAIATPSSKSKGDKDSKRVSFGGPVSQLLVPRNLLSFPRIAATEAAKLQAESNKGPASSGQGFFSPPPSHEDGSSSSSPSPSSAPTSLSSKAIFRKK